MSLLAAIMIGIVLLVLFLELALRMAVGVATDSMAEKLVGQGR